MSPELRFRQIHLDFHTSPHISGIGMAFDKREWQETLKGAAVDSITLFSKCHHGWSYHPSKVGKMHPNLTFDLLRAQYDATKEAGINAPIYLSAGVDNLASHEHPEWREVDKDGRYTGWSKGLLQAGFHMMDFHSPYLEYLCDQIRETVRLFPDCDGIFLDIIAQNEACGRWSLEFMGENGLDPKKEEDRRESSRLALAKYYHLTTAAVKSLRSDMPVFHNAGHIPRGRHDIFSYFSHFELESLPTGGWGYDHFPMSAKYACNLPFEFLGMTGKFHTTWGEFGGYKHPNALRYECAAMLAFGSKCSVGDQLHPSGRLDSSTYEIIGEAYRDVKAKEEWCRGAEQVFDLAILSSEAENAGHRENLSDEGASRVFLENHFLFGLIDRTMDFQRFKVIVLPDDICIDEALKEKLDDYLNGGGGLVLSGKSGLWKDRDAFAFDLGAEYHGLSPFHPPGDEPQRGHDYMQPVPALCPSFAKMPQIMYERSHRIHVTTGESLGKIFDPYFNRTWDHFCSHQHAPNQTESSGFDCGSRQGNILYFSHPVFRHYRSYGAVANREFITRSIRTFFGDSISLDTNLPSTARVALTSQEERFILHLLYAPTISRGGVLQLSGGNTSGGQSVEVIEDLPPLHNIRVTLQLPAGDYVASLVPQGTPLEIGHSASGWNLFIPEFACHQMIEIRRA